MLVNDVADFVKQTRYEDLPPRVADAMALMLLDCVGCILVGSSVSSAHHIDRAISCMQDPSPHSAGSWLHAMRMGSYCHSIELSDAYPRSVVHTGTAVVPAMIAAAGRGPVSGHDILLAMALGYEMLIRFGYAVATDEKRDIGDDAASFDAGWFPPAVVGPIGAAVAATKLMKLSAAQIANAISISANLAPTALMQSAAEGATVKDLLVGWASGVGLLSADFAAFGLTGPNDLENGWMSTISPRTAPQAILRELGSNYELLEGLVIKHFSCVGPLFGAIEACLQLQRERAIDTDRITSIYVESYHRAMRFTNTHPTTPAGARASLPFCVALALLKPRRQLFLKDAFSQQWLDDPKVAGLAGKVSMSEGAEFEQCFPACNGARVKVRMEDGTEHEHSVSNVPGWSEYPDRGAITEKFMLLCAPIMGEASAQAVCNAVIEITSHPTGGSQLAQIISKNIETIRASKQVRQFSVV